MSFSNYYEYEWDSYYCYPNTFILKNKLNILDNNLLEEAERQITSLRILELKTNPIKGSLDLKHLLNIHKYIFQDIYKWAGKTRTVNITKGNKFCNYLYIDEIAKDLFLQLEKDKYLIGLELEQVIIKLSYYLSEINALHPFRDGNGRAQRIFIEYLAQTSGYYIDFSKVTKQKMIDASADSFICNYEKMVSLIRKSIEPITLEEQKGFLNLLSSSNGILLKIFNEVL